MFWRMSSIIGSVLLLLVTTLVKSQDNCECMSIILCQGKSSSSNECSGDEVCCVTDVAPATTEKGTETPATTEKGTETPAKSCGVPSKGLILKVEGESFTEPGDFPWMVAVMEKKSGSVVKFLCGGSIIELDAIVTTAHSISNYSAGDLVVWAGVWNATDSSEEVQHRSVSEIKIHPKYNGKSRYQENDIAVLLLSDLLEPTSNVDTVCLPSPKLPVNTSKCVATGWGGSKNFENSANETSVLKSVEMTLVDKTSCEASYRRQRGFRRFNLDRSFICAKGVKAGEDTCSGDGGGPLMCPTLQDEDRWVQVGITSWGAKCGESTPGVYASTEDASDFIKEAIKDDFMPVFPKIY